MRQKIYVLLLLLVTGTTCLQASTMDVFWHVGRFFHVENEAPYIELAYLIPGPEVTYVSATEEMYSLSFKIEIIQEEELVVAYNYQNSEKQLVDGAASMPNIENLQRIQVPTGTIDLILTITDDLDSLHYFSDFVTIDVPEKKEAFLSDIMLVSQVREALPDNPFYRNGQSFIPKYMSYYPKEVSELNFYTEYYQPNNEAQYLIKYMIAEETGMLITDLSNHKKVKGSFEAMYTGFNIGNLPSGNYYLYVELRSETNELIERKRAFFQRSNNVESTDIKYNSSELDVITNNFARKYDLRNIIHHTAALAPIADEFQIAAIQGVIAGNDLTSIQNYFFSFWKNLSPVDPELAWNTYAEDLQYAENVFTTSLKQGFETSRGRVYLKYGKPVERIERRNSQYGEFEVWYYEQLNGASGIYFVFVNDQLGDNDFLLVHSNAAGEIFDRFWFDIIKNGDY